ncbi:MAG: adenylate/guanylate cyclase domain-containing protein [Treponema sp.]|nr:adenylate/guanylate cyclase domain-containing protein [Treponema sp.]
MFFSKLKKRQKTLLGFQKVGETAIVPISVKILSIFVILILLSCLTTNFITLVFSQRQTILMTNDLLVYQLSDLYTTATNQFQIGMYSQKQDESVKSIEETARRDFSRPHSLAMGVRTDGSFLFNARNDTSKSWYRFSDEEALGHLNQSYAAAVEAGTPERVEGSVSFTSPYGDEYMGVYKWHDDWKCFLIRGELRADTRKEMYSIFFKISLIIVILTIGFVFVGISVLNLLLSDVRKFTKEVYDLQQSQDMNNPAPAAQTKAPIDLSEASNDDITYLAANFNDLYVNTANLRNIFQKFVSKNVVDTAYHDHKVELKGEQRQLTILFTDIKNFTNRTEVLGNDIIRLLNIHYNSIIGIIQPDGLVEENRSKAFIGSLIGDAVLGVFGINGTKDSHDPQKSVDAVACAWKMTVQTKSFRQKMDARRKELMDEGRFDDQAQKVYEAVRIDIGVGIDGGEVFYGNIGSNKYMANTVIGDNVNSASRIEGLTRVYRLPVLVSEYVVEEIKQVREAAERYRFFEVDTVQVKGKKIGKRIYFPLDLEQTDEEFKSLYTVEKFEEFEIGLKAYYDGDWKSARSHFKKSELDVAQVFLSRIGLKSAPEGWSGIWTMTTK